MTEDQLELEAINWLVDSGYTHLCGYDIASDSSTESLNQSAWRTLCHTI